MVTNIQYHASPEGKSTTEERPLPGRMRYKRCPCSSVGALSHPCCCVLPIFSKQMCPINNTSPYSPLQREREALTRACAPAHAHVCTNTRSEKHHTGQLHYVRTTSPAPLETPPCCPRPPPSAVLRHQCSFILY